MMVFLISEKRTINPGPLFNTGRYNTVLDITLIIVGPQLDYFGYMSICFFSCYNTDWIANTEIGLDASNSVIKRLRCIFQCPNTVQAKQTKLHVHVVAIWKMVLWQNQSGSNIFYYTNL